MSLNSGKVVADISNPRLEGRQMEKTGYFGRYKASDIDLWKESRFRE